MLRRQVEKGKGLLLLANANRILPRLLGGNLEGLRTYTGYFGQPGLVIGVEAEPSARQHELFRGLSPAEPGKAVFPLVSFVNWDFYKRVMWKARGEINENGSSLARMHVEKTNRKGPVSQDKELKRPMYEPTPVLWEWRVGEGRILGYACSLRLLYGSGGPAYSSDSLEKIHVFRDLTDGSDRPDYSSPSECLPSQNLLMFVQNMVRYLAKGKGEINVGVLCGSAGSWTGQVPQAP
jgi:hypothetical protein